MHSVAAPLIGSYLITSLRKDRSKDWRIGSPKHRSNVGTGVHKRYDRHIGRDHYVVQGRWCFLIDLNSRGVVRLLAECNSVRLRDLDRVKVLDRWRRALSAGSLSPMIAL